MPRTAVRAVAAFAALAGLVLGLVVCGPASASATAAEHGPRAAETAATGPASPGCGRSHGAEEGAVAPAVPPRAHAFGELLPALAGERTPCGGWAADQDAVAVRAGRAPPGLVPPSPMELSILRV
ncbi:hypothetical protein AB0A60_09005 [Streptomyces sp. NPDC046275]|uniref:hypothetical protein n=1 Tax=Streptomyces sp. NPDC046275 TaxID=3157201 RepID=UPI00340141E4